MKTNFLFFRIKRKIFSKILKNKIAKDILKQDMTYNYLYKKFNKTIINSNYYEINDKINKTIWVCWLQGIEQAPELVKVCYNKLKKSSKGYKVVLITSKNFKDYVNIPEFIISKWKKGIISNTHFSDILRIELLAQNGGIWIDSTVFVTMDKVPKYLEENPLFVFKEVNLNRIDEPLISASNWFMKANSNHPIILLTRDLLIEYWSKTDILIDYFVFHLFFTMARKKYSNLWNDIPVYNNINPHILQFELLSEYKTDRFEYYKKVSDFHKLSYKLKIEKKAYTSNLDYIMMGDK